MLLEAFGGVWQARRRVSYPGSVHLSTPKHVLGHVLAISARFAPGPLPCTRRSVKRGGRRLWPLGTRMGCGETSRRPNSIAAGSAVPFAFAYRAPSLSLPVGSCCHIPADSPGHGSEWGSRKLLYSCSVKDPLNCLGFRGHTTRKSALKRNTRVGRDAP